MIPHKTDRSITIGGIDNEHKFSIATSGKAFRALIDTVYSDKVLAPVRELITNAADAHVAAGNPSPFLVIVPTQLDPTFGVRDYGTGMDHDTITNLYTTLFASSKDGSNDETGMLGLGSKSPFAYTDTFTVEAFDGVSKRSYMAYTKEDIPSLSLVGTSPSDEPRGICVKFPAQAHHRYEFAEAVYKVIRGLDIVPELDGVELDTSRLFQTVREGNGWRMVEGGGDSHAFVRQGGVLYPLENRILDEAGFPRRGYYGRVTFVFDAPIGTADVTLSRESLSYDAETAASLTAIVKAAWEELKAQIEEEYEACSSQHDHMQWLSTVPQFLRDAKGFSFSSYVLKGLYDLHPAHFKAGRVWTQDEMKAAKPEDYPLSIKEKRIVHSIAADDVERVMFVLDDGVTPRRRSRMLAWLNEGGQRTHMLIENTPKQAAVVKRLKALMHLRDDQFIPVADTYDEGPRRVARGAARTKSELQEKLDDGAIWVERFRNTLKFRADGVMSFEYDMQYLDYQLKGTKWEGKVITLTPHQIDKMKPNPANSLALQLKEEADKYVDATFGQRWNYEIRSGLESAGCAHTTLVAEHLGYRVNSPTPPAPLLTNPMINYMVNVRPHPDTAAIVAAAQEKYPALFPKPIDMDTARDYLHQQDTNPNTTTTSQEATS